MVMPSRVSRHALAARPWRSRTGRRLHRALDATGWQALDRDRDPGRAPAAGEVSVMTSPRVLLTTLSVRVSAKGRQYLSGWLGKASVVAFAGQPDKHGNPTWDVYLSEPEMRDGPQRPSAKPPERDSAAGRPTRGSPRVPARLPAALDGPPGARARRRGGNAWPARSRPPTASAKVTPMIRCRSEPPDLHELGRRLRRLVPCWQDPTRFYRQRDDLVDHLHRLARNGPPEAPGRPAGPSEEHRLRTLLVLKNDEIARLRGLLAEARPRPRRRRVRDDRQLLLTL
jgi:hypothetical protein